MAVAVGELSELFSWVCWISLKKTSCEILKVAAEVAAEVVAAMAEEVETKKKKPK